MYSRRYQKYSMEDCYFLFKLFARTTLSTHLKTFINWLWNSISSHTLKFWVQIWYTNYSYLILKWYMEDLFYETLLLVHKTSYLDGRATYERFGYFHKYKCPKSRKLCRNIHHASMKTRISIYSYLSTEESHFHSQRKPVSPSGYFSAKPDRVKML